MSRTDPHEPHTGLPPSPASPASPERAALLRTVGGMTPAIDADLRRAASETAESRERLAFTAERRIWRTQDAAQAVLARDVGAYARALRAGGMSPRQVLATIVAVVREAASPAVTGGPLDDLVHDAGRHCIAACFAP